MERKTSQTILLWNYCDVSYIWIKCCSWSNSSNIWSFRKLWNWKNRSFSSCKLIHSSLLIFICQGNALNSDQELRTVRGFLFSAQALSVLFSQTSILTIHQLFLICENASKLSEYNTQWISNKYLRFIIIPRGLNFSTESSSKEDGICSGMSKDFDLRWKSYMSPSKIKNPLESLHMPHMICMKPKS